MKRSGLILLAFLFSANAICSPLKIGIIDTGFCPNKINLQAKKIIIHPVKDATSSVKMDCDKLNQNDRRFHGQWVLESFINDAPKDMQIEIWPVIIFDSQSIQKSAYWAVALKYLEQEKADVVLSAAGLPIMKTIPVELKLINSKFFVASGRAGGPIKSDTRLFPHELAPNPALFIIGSFYPPLHKDDYLLDGQLLYQKQIDFYFSEGPLGAHFVGTSRSVATGLARALEVCPKEFTEQANLLRSCLEKNKKWIKDSSSQKVIPTL